MWLILTSFCCSCTCPIWNQISSSVNGGGGEFTIYLKHYKLLVNLRDIHVCKTNLQALSIFGLLLVYYAQSEVYLVRFLEVGLHLHDLGESLFSVVEGAVPVVQNTNPIPQLRFLDDISSLMGKRG